MLSAMPAASLTTTNVALSANSLQLATSVHVLLSTAVVNVTSGLEVHCTPTLDNGSTTNFVTRSLVEILDITTRYEHQSKGY